MTRFGLTMLLALALAAAGPLPDAHANGRPTARWDARAIRSRTGRITGALSRLRTQPQSRGTVARYLANGYRRDLATMLDSVAALSQTSLPPRERLRSVAAVARTLLAVEREAPGTHSPEAMERVRGMLADAQFDARVESHETAVELELGMTHTLFDMLTTVDGTIGPVLAEGGKAAPAWLAGVAQGRDPSSVRWGELTRSQRRELIQSQTAGRDFFSNRRIPGLRLSRRVSRPANAPRGSGRVRALGTTMDVSEVVQPYMEFRGPDDVANVTGVEMHVRQHGRAGANYRDAVAIRAGLGYRGSSFHQHITTRMPREILSGDDVERIAFVDFYRRVNLVAEMRAVAAGSILKRNASHGGSVINFDYLSSDGLASLNSHLAAVGGVAGASRLSGHSQLKMAAVGFRPGQLYGDDNLVGFEARTLDIESPDGRDDAFVDAVQRGLVTRAYGVPRDALQSWTERADGARGPMRLSRQNNALKRLHYNRAVSELVAAAPAALGVDAAVSARLSEIGTTNYGARMLVHDWSQDPALGGDEALLSRVTEAQRRGIARMMNRDSMQEVVRDFVVESGLLGAFERSIGMR